MDGPHTTPARRMRIERASEQTHLHRRLTAAAYERVCPVIRRRLVAGAHRTDDRKGERMMPQAMAAGA